MGGLLALTSLVEAVEAYVYGTMSLEALGRRVREIVVTARKTPRG